MAGMLNDNRARSRLWSQLSAYPGYSDPFQEFYPLAEANPADLVVLAACRAQEPVGSQGGQVVVFGGLALEYAPILGAIEALEVSIEVNEDIQLAVLAVVCALIRVAAVQALVHPAAAIAAKVEGVALGAFGIYTAYPGVIRFTAILAPVHPTTLLRNSGQLEIHTI